MVKSIRGKEINMQALKFNNQYATAVGNVRKNARGDLLGKNGKIIKTREQINQEYNTKVKNAAVNVSISKDAKKTISEANAKIDKKPTTPKK